MARRRRASTSPHLTILSALGSLWLLLALWTFYPLCIALLTQLLFGLTMAAMTGQPFTFAWPTVWIVPGAVPWLGLVTLALVGTWAWVVRSAAVRRAAGKGLAELQQLTPTEFEQWVGARFRELGYRMRATGGSGDHGVDLVGDRDTEKVVIQCKRYRNSPVGEPAVRELLGALQHERADRAFVVTTSYFTAAAREWARGKPMELWDGDKLMQLGSGVPFAAAGPEVTLPMGDVAASALVPHCPRCDSALVERRNRRTGDAFLACPRFPNCRYTQRATSGARR